MKISIRLVCLLGLIFVCNLFSCKKSNNNDLFYNSLHDSIPPVNAISVPINTGGTITYHYGDYIHFVGTVTDLETAYKSGKLSSLILEVNQVNLSDSNIRNYLTSTPNVDGKDGFTFNEQLIIPVGTLPIQCKFTITSTDYSGRKDKDSLYFQVIN